MILIADSGSSKADWVLSTSARKIEFRTSGINPFFVSEKDIIKVFHNTSEIQPYLNLVKEIYFFGSGCSSPDRRELISNALSKVFKNAFISVENDLTGSVYATCGSSAGLSCILGTGSNITYFDGVKITNGKHGLGYILGDEGSGTYFGRKLITSFLYGTMPDDLQLVFDKTYGINKEIIIKEVYQKPAPNSYLASFAKFMSNHKEHPFIQNLLRQGFEEFVTTDIMSYSNYKNHTCHFVGSIAFHFQDVLKEVCLKYEVSVGKILKHPIEELSRFILSKN
ncbi:MAG: N-acetylglucosamine kinase [Daejeonella sp.]